MKNEEQMYIIPLGKAYDYKRTKRAIRAVDIMRAFLLRHTKAQDARISMKINELIWSRSIQKPPRKIKVKVVKKENIAYAYLPDEKMEEEKPKEEPKAEKKADKKEEKKEEKKVGEKTAKKVAPAENKGEKQK